MKKFNEFIEERLSDTIKAELQTKNPEHPFLKAFKSDKDYQEIKEMWDKGDRQEAARTFRAKLVKIANSKLGMALMLMVSGAVMTSVGYKILTTPPPPGNPPIPPPNPMPTGAKDYVIQKGDCLWNIAKANAPKNVSTTDLLAYMDRIGMANNLHVQHIQNAVLKLPGDTDMLFPGGHLIIPKF